MFLTYFMEKTNVPQEAVKELLSAQEKAVSAGAQEDLALLSSKFMAELPSDAKWYIEKIAELSQKTGVSTYKYNYLLYALCARILKERYAQRGIDEQIFWNSMSDMTYKVIECMKVKKEAGIFADNWYPGFFNFSRFALGRLQYDMKRAFACERYERKGFVLKKGDPVLNIHIPSGGGPLTRQARMDSYKKAHEFVKKDYPGGITPIVCNSWLLYPEHVYFLPPASNILGFMSDFDIIEQKEYDEFHSSWRIFYNSGEVPPEDLPEDTSLQRAYKKRLVQGGKTGSGYGVLLFDGTDIIRD